MENRGTQHHVSMSHLLLVQQKVHACSTLACYVPRSDESTGALLIRFDSGLVHTGSVDLPYVTTMTWQDGSVWQKQPSGNFVLHFIDHSHTGEIYIIDSTSAAAVRFHILPPLQCTDPGWKSTIDQRACVLCGKRMSSTVSLHPVPVQCTTTVSATSTTP